VNPQTKKAVGKSQADKFKNLARGIEVTFDKALGRIARARPPKERGAKKG
jgi:hypothetical protein